MFRSGLFRQPPYWIAMAIVFAFMIPVDGWLTKLSAPIVIYRDADTSGIRPIWDILVEEFAYAFALLTLVILAWDRARREANRVTGALAPSAVGVVRGDGGVSATPPTAG